MTRPLRILYVASEVAPFAKTGGLADVLGALPRALAARGHECVVVAPRYRSALAAPEPLEPTAHAVEVPLAARRVAGRLWKSRLPRSDVPVYLIEQPDYFDRDDPAQGRGLYQYRLAGGKMQDYPDNSQRFIFFSRAVLEAAAQLEFCPDVIHANDWQTGLIPVYVSKLYRRRPGFGPLRTLYTIHNLAYQGIFWHWDLALTGLDWKLFNWRQLEFYGHLNFMKAGIVFADAVNAVSPRYAREIQTSQFGCGLEGVLRQCRDKLTGIVNGVDYDDWDPATDPHLAARYDAERVQEGKAVCKAALQQEVGLPVRPDVPVLGVISRLAEQKGWDLIQAASNELVRLEVQLVVLGVGDEVYHRFLTQLRQQHPDQVAVIFDFNEELAHRIEAGADLFLMPSRFEPSGLNQLYSLKYGTVPVVRDTGGLADTVTDCTPASLAAGTATGFVFQEYTAAAFLAAVARALALRRQAPEQWRQMQRTAMGQDWSWRRSAAQYEELYRKLADLETGR